MSSTTSASNPNAVAAAVPSNLPSPVAHIADPYIGGISMLLSLLSVCISFSSALPMDDLKEHGEKFALNQMRLYEVTLNPLQQAAS
jgi:hypothetical protein